MSLTSYHCYYRTILNEKRRVVIDSLKVNCYQANRNDLCLCAANQIRTDTSSLEGSYAKPLNTIAAKLARSKNHNPDIIGNSYANVSKWRKVIIHLIYNNLLVKCTIGTLAGILRIGCGYSRYWIFLSLGYAVKWAKPNFFTAHYAIIVFRLSIC